MADPGPEASRPEDRIQEFLDRAGCPIGDRDLAAQALTHASWLHEHPGEARGHNERLEFLGDSVINLAVSQAIYRHHPDDDEGLLSARRASIVSTTGLAAIAARLGLGEMLRLGEGESRRGGRVRPSVLASGLESLAGAVFLDGGWEAASGWITALADPELQSNRPPASLKSPKSRLQEYTQREGGARPEYRLLNADGPDHDRTFHVAVFVGGTELGRGTGASRRTAETQAAIEALRTIAGGEA